MTDFLKIFLEAITAESAGEAPRYAPPGVRVVLPETKWRLLLIRLRIAKRREMFIPYEIDTTTGKWVIEIPRDCVVTDHVAPPRRLVASEK